MSLKKPPRVNDVVIVNIDGVPTEVRVESSNEIGFTISGMDDLFLMISIVPDEGWRLGRSDQRNDTAGEPVAWRYRSWLKNLLRG